MSEARDCRAEAGAWPRLAWPVWRKEDVLVRSLASSLEQEGEPVTCAVTPPRRAAQAVLPGLRGALHPAFRVLPQPSGGGGVGDGGVGGGGAALLPTRRWGHVVLLTVLRGTEDGCAQARGPG